MLPGTVIAASLTYLLMLAAYFLPRRRYFHIPAMIAIILFDVGMPFYLYMHRDWWHRLIEQQNILSSLVWMHFLLLATMYTLDAAQIYTARKLLKGDPEAREEHRSQGKALLIVRGLVILTGAALASPEDKG
jgi:hypothetical protein